LLSRNRGGVVKAVNVTLFNKCFTLKAAVVIEPCVANDVEYPGFEPALVTEELPVFQNPEEDLLNQIVRDMETPCHSNEVIEKRSLMPVKQYTKHSYISVTHDQHKTLVSSSHPYLRTACIRKGSRWVA